MEAATRWAQGCPQCPMLQKDDLKYQLVAMWYLIVKFQSLWSWVQHSPYNWSSWYLLSTGTMGKLVPSCSPHHTSLRGPAMISLPHGSAWLLSPISLQFQIKVPVRKTYIYISGKNKCYEIKWDKVLVREWRESSPILKVLTEGYLRRQHLSRDLYEEVEGKEECSRHRKQWEQEGRPCLS